MVALSPVFLSIFATTMSKLLRMSDPLQTRASLIDRLPDAADIAAWDEFVALYGPLVYRLSRRQNLQPSDADDVVQEVLSAVAQSVEDWLRRTDRGGFRAWLFRIARNKTVNFLTLRRHRPLGQGGEEGQTMMQQLVSSDAVDAEFESAYRQELFRSASRHVRPAVSDKSWQAFHLTTVLGHSIQETGELLNMTTGNVYVARSRVMARLREWVQKFEEAAE